MTRATRPPPQVRFQSPAREPEPAPQPPPREPRATASRTSPGAAQLALALLEAGTSISEAARRTHLSRTTVRRLWRTGHTGPPPGRSAASGRPGPPVTVTPAQAREAIVMRGQRRPSGRWERSIVSIAGELGVSRGALYRAIERAEKAGTEERQS